MYKNIVLNFKDECIIVFFKICYSDFIIYIYNNMLYILKYFNKEKY